MKLTEKEQIQESISELRFIARILSEIDMDNYFLAPYEGEDVLKIANRLTSILKNL
jgi:hypothetical protein